jgi:hypothetical protein
MQGNFVTRLWPPNQQQSLNHVSPSSVTYLPLPSLSRDIPNFLAHVHAIISPWHASKASSSGIMHVVNSTDSAASNPGPIKPNKSYLQEISSSPGVIKNRPALPASRPRSIVPLEGRCFRCLSRSHRRRDCREPLRCKSCLRYGHSSVSCRSHAVFTESISNPSQPSSQPSSLLDRNMEFNADLLAGLDRQEEDLSGIPVFHHPVHGAAPYPPPTEQIIIGPIDFTDFLQPENIDEIFAGLEDIGEVNLPIVDMRLFDNVALASLFPHTETPAPIIRAALSSELNSSFFRLVQCSQASALVIFRTPHMCLIATNTAQFEIDWEGTSFVVSIIPHDMTGNRIRLDQGFLVNLEVLDFPVEYWCKELIAAAFYPFSPVIIIEQLCLTGSNFSAISLCLNIRQAWLPRRILINAGPEGIMF